ncbi:MAG: UPF0280 family protein [Deltaproteobacteria bacterium]|nr:UPF0280 family protein [Deltaproteobacteria bacterium]
MTEYKERIYRKRVNAGDLVSFNVAVKETDLWVSSDRDLEKETRDLVFDCRNHLESYIRSNPEFKNTLQPYPEDPYAPPMVQEMIRATRTVGVGPMASVAGAVAQSVAEGLLGSTDQVIVENGGDIFLRVNRPVTVSVFAGESPLSEKIGLMIPTGQMPLGICSSSGTVGHSLSMGAADVVCLLSPSALLADGAATALGNRIREKKDLERVKEWADGITDLLGGVVILGDSMATWGDIELVGL